MSCDAYVTVEVSNKFEVDTTIRCLVIALLLLIRYVTLWPWPWSAVIHGRHVINPSTKFEDPAAIRSWVISSDISHRIPLTMRLQPLRMRRITWPMRSGKFFPHIWNPWPQFAYSLHNFLGATIKINGVNLSGKTVYGPVLKTTQLSARAQNHASTERCRKSFTIIFLGDHDIPLTGSNFGNLTTFRAVKPPILGDACIRVCIKYFLQFHDLWTLLNKIREGVALSPLSILHKTHWYAN